MWQSVRNYFFEFNRPFEGLVPYMYLDVLGYVTTGVGNLLSSPQEAADLPFYHSSAPQNLATYDEKVNGWNKVKSRQDLKNNVYTVFEDLCDLRLSNEAILNLVDSKLTLLEKTVLHTFPNFNNYPADAQLAILSMGWAMGDYRLTHLFPKFINYCKNLDFKAAGNESHMDETGNAGLVKRNAADRVLLNNAANVLLQGLDISQLIYPTTLLEETIIEIP